MPAGTQVGVVGFSDQPSVVSPFTTDQAALTTAINAVEARRGDCPLRRRRDRGVTARHDVTARRHVTVLLSDGGDTASTGNIDAAASALAVRGQRRLCRRARHSGDRRSRARPTRCIGRWTRGVGVRSRRSSASSTTTSPWPSPTSTSSRSRRPTREASWCRPRSRLTASRPRRTITVDLGAPAPVAPIETRPVRVTTSSAPLFGGAGWALGLGGLLVFLALVVGGVVLLAPRERVSMIAAERRTAKPRRHEEAIGDFVGSASRFADRALERRGHRATLNDALERAGIDMRPGEFMVLAAGVTIAVLFVGSPAARPDRGRSRWE